MASGNTSAPAYDARVDAAIVSAKRFREEIGRVLDQGSFTLHTVLDRWLAWIERGEAEPEGLDDADNLIWHAVRMLAGHGLDGFYPETTPVVGEIVAATSKLAATLDIAIAERDSCDSWDNPGNCRWAASDGDHGKSWTTGAVSVIVEATDDLVRAVAALASEAGVDQVSK